MLLESFLIIKKIAWKKSVRKSTCLNLGPQVYLNLAKEEFRLKQNLVHEFTQSTKESNKASTQI